MPSTGTSLPLTESDRHVTVAHLVDCPDCERRTEAFRFRTGSQSWMCGHCGNHSVLPAGAAPLYQTINRRTKE